MDVRLVVIEGFRLGTVVPIAGSRFLIGRDPSCQLRPKSSAVSAFHCEVLVGYNEVRVKDLDSTNGTLVNQRCLHYGEEMRVKDGDRLQIAQLSFTIRIDPGPPIPQQATTHESKIVDWLTGQDTTQDPSERTALLPCSLINLEASPSAPVARDVSPPGEVSDAGSVFAYRMVDSASDTTIFGVSPLQLVTSEDARALCEALLAWSDRSPLSMARRLVLDLSAVEALPSSVYALLPTLSESCRRLGGAVRLCSASSEVKHWLRSLGLDPEVPCFEDRAQALASPWP